MELAVDAAQSRQLPEFLERFAGRAARMVNAAWGGVAVFRGRETDLYSAAETELNLSAALKSWLITAARDNRTITSILPQHGGEADPASQAPGAASMNAIFVPILSLIHI